MLALELAPDVEQHGAGSNQASPIGLLTGAVRQSADQTDESHRLLSELVSSRAPMKGSSDASAPTSSAFDDLPVNLLGAYLNEISRVPLLSASEEVALALAIRQGVEARRRKDLLISPDPELERALGPAIERGERARCRLTEANLRLVVSVARSYVGHQLTLLDLIQEGNLGLLRAVARFDPSLGFRFSTYATWWIRQSIGRSIDCQGRTIRLPVHVAGMARRVYRTAERLLQELGSEPSSSEIGAELGLPAEKVDELFGVLPRTASLDSPVGPEEDATLGDFIEDSSADDPLEIVDRLMLREKLAAIVRSLPEREGRVLELRFGLGDGRERTLEEVGRELGVTRERIRQIEQQALKRLRKPRRSRQLRDYAA
jgi:RNA polymerase primary sigma factor